MNYESGLAPWGVDADMIQEKSSELQNTNHLGKKICVSMIRFFQQNISPIDGPRSSFFPSSSQYTLEAIEKYGVLQGIALGCDRLMRENKELWVYEVAHHEGLTRKMDPVR